MKVADFFVSGLSPTQGGEHFANTLSAAPN